MITGTVAPSLHPCVRFDVQAIDGSFRTVEAAVDTGFTDYVSLPEPTVALLGLRWLHQDQILIGNGIAFAFDVHAATIIWNGQPRVVRVMAGGPLPLVGTALLRGHDLRVRFEVGGPVEIEPIP
jgi:clan AA aspartic protease